MRYTLTDDERGLRSSLRSFLSHSSPADKYEAICERDDGFDQELWSRLAASGWLDLHAMSLMGSDGSAWPIAGVHMAEEFGRHLVPAPVELVAGFLLPVLRSLEPGALGVNLDDGVTEDLWTVHLRPLLQLVYPQVRPSSDRPTVERTEDGLVVSGQFPAVQFAASAESMFLPVELGDEWALVRVRLGAEGVLIEAGRTVDPGRTCATVTLSAVVVPAQDVALVDADGRPVVDVLATELLSYLLFLDGKAVGASEALLERTVRYVTDRKQFGVPIGSFQAVKHRVAEMATMIESARSLASYTAWRVSQRHDDRVEATLASRLHSADVYRRVCESAIQCHGGMGFTWEVGLHFWYQSAVFDAGATDLALADLARVLGGAS
ncbi:MAG: Isovaleryl-CoA dehydrogenase [Ramlibacter sp.]|nr:Isovaleryl-CoA dehydrogenase [Ramlibacter sp.]